MGWDFITGIDRDELVKRLTTTEVAPDWTCAAHELAHEQGTAVLWAVWANPTTDRRMIVCHLLEPGHGGWGHKDFAESSGPFYYSCPRRFHELAPEVNPAWRERVREYHQRAPDFDRLAAMVAINRAFHDGLALPGTSEPGHCPSRFDPEGQHEAGYRCTLSTGHDGDHEAEGTTPGEPVYGWGAGEGMAALAPTSPGPEVQR